MFFFLLLLAGVRAKLKTERKMWLHRASETARRESKSERKTPHKLSVSLLDLLACILYYKSFEKSIYVCVCWCWPSRQVGWWWGKNWARTERRKSGKHWCGVQTSRPFTEVSQARNNKLTWKIWKKIKHLMFLLLKEFSVLINEEIFPPSHRWLLNKI